MILTNSPSQSSKIEILEDENLAVSQEEAFT
jgi:hypothetical protein